MAPWDGPGGFCWRSSRVRVTGQVTDGWREAPGCRIKADVAPTSAPFLEDAVFAALRGTRFGCQRRRVEPVMPIVLAVVVSGCVALAMPGLVLAQSYEALLRARISANESSVIATLRAIISAQATFAVTCSEFGYAVNLADLARPQKGSTSGFMDPKLATNDGVISGYRITMDRKVGSADVGSAADTCNGSSAAPASGYFVSAAPLKPGDTGTRYFAADDRGTIYVSTAPIKNPITESASVVKLQ